MDLLNIQAIILAAGKGKRMLSDTPKVLHKICGIPIINCIKRTLSSIGIEVPIIVLGHKWELVKEYTEEPNLSVLQKEQLGTGHAVKVCMPHLTDSSKDILILSGDMPLITPETLNSFIEFYYSTKANLSILSLDVNNPTGYGRIIRDNKMGVERIVEEKDATSIEKKIKEVFSGIYLVKQRMLQEALENLDNFNMQKEYYLTDIVHYIYNKYGKVNSFKAPNSKECMGINDRYQLSEANLYQQEQIQKKLNMSGVTIINPLNTYIEWNVKIEKDVTIYPGVNLLGDTVIESGCTIGPNCTIQDSHISKNSHVFHSCINQSRLGENVKCGPFANLRPGSILKNNVKIGNFVEIKNSEINDTTSVSHLSYVGDATVGKNVNIGAGTITCNYDGFQKNRTIIQDDAFIGSNSTLIPPLTIEKNTLIAAGSVITENVKENSLAIARSKQECKENWVPAWKNKMKGNLTKK